ncbi:MAG: amino acid adenylation domain-containing protein, partial [Acidobacteriota bacterium]
MTSHAPPAQETVAPPPTARALLRQLESLDVRLAVEGDQLRLDAPKGTLTLRLAQDLRARKEDLIELLSRPRTGEPRPLSFSQERLFFLHRLIAQPIYNLGGCLRLRGPLRAEALENALRRLIERHEVLRTTFAEGPDGPRQTAHPRSPFAMAAEDLRDFRDSASGDSSANGSDEEAGVEGAVAEWLDREALRPFDLGSGPLLRALLLRLGERDFVLLITLHHIVSDAWSVGIFQRELAAFYAAEVEGQDSGLPRLTSQYADYAEWQRRLLAEGGLEEQLGYWSERLCGSSPLELPYDRRRPKEPTYRAGRAALALDGPLSERVRRLSQRLSCTPFMTLLAALSVSLSRWTGQRDVAVASPIANRHRREVEGLIGFFVNTQILRLDLAAAETFADLVLQAREVCLGAHAHQDVPFDLLVERLQPERAEGENPFSQVIFSFHNVPSGAQELAGLEVEPVPFESGRLRLDLEIYLGESEGGFEGHVLYNRDVFDAATVERLLAVFEYLTASLAATPDARLDSHDPLPPEQADLIFGAWRGELRPISPRASMVERFRGVAEAHPSRPALVLEGDSWTYRQLDRRSTLLAHKLAAAGVQPGDAVAVLCERSFELILSLLAILKAGGAYLSLESGTPEERLRFMARDAGVRLALVSGSAQARSAEGLGLEAVDARGFAAAAAGIEDLGENSRPLDLASIDADSLAYVAYTSGSTGEPKGALIPHRAVLRLVDDPSFLDIRQEDVFLQMAPVAFDASTLEIWGALLNGATLAIMPPGPVALESLGSRLEADRVSVLWLTAGLFHLMVDHHLEALAGVRRLLAGGDVLSPERCRRWATSSGLRPDALLINGYGPTENTTFTCCHALQPGREVPSPVPVGKPISGTEIFILDEALRPVPAGSVGELYAGGHGLARGYLGRPELTAERFVPHPFPPAGESDAGPARLYRTGDRARFLADGSVQFLGRVDHQVKIRGFRVEPGEVEAVLQSLPETQACAVVARSDGETGEATLNAYVVPRPPSSLADSAGGRD